MSKTIEFSGPRVGGLKTDYLEWLGLDSEHAKKYPAVLPGDTNLMLSPEDREMYEATYSPEMVAMVDLLEASVKTFDETPGRGDINGLAHSLQAGTRALNAEAPRSEVVLAAIHDSMRVLAPDVHEDVLAALMQNRLPEDHVIAIYHHSEFQVDIMQKTKTTRKYKDEPWYGVTKRLAGRDGASFKPTYRTRPLGFFLPMINVVCYPDLRGTKSRELVTLKGSAGHGY